ncbi:hypothetical protein G9470_20090 [Bacteroides xylanolyticus]|uniref:DNA (cytosine-5-)-methyltransferase n=1 Tax=Lacrimispora defluvii TaxID=2719233 RepID=A0ABX1VUE6_9FIRM|nr:hypothetical protein [Lacrimispora defluvii]
MLNTGVSPNDARESFLSQILEETPLQKYYLSRTACLGILRRARSRGKELPKQLKTALEIQAGIADVKREVSADIKKEYKSYHINNQRNEGIDLNGISGALMATQNMQMQTFITEPMLCLNDQGGNRMDITENITSTLRASMGGNLPIVMGSQQGGAEICEDLCPTITSAAGTSGNNQPVLFDNHAKDCRYNGSLRVAPTVAATYGTGGNNVPLVSKPMEESYCIASNIINRQDKNGGNGCGFQENISYTLTTSDIHAVCLPSKTYQNIVGALCVGDEKGIGSQYVSQNKCIVDSQKMKTGLPNENTEKQPVSDEASKENENNSVKNSSVIKLVRRLTPLECERLQGFPDGWTDIPKATDSPRYKGLGNSVAVTCVDFIMRGIAYFLRKF